MRVAPRRAAFLLIPLTCILTPLMTITCVFAIAVVVVLVNPIIPLSDVAVGWLVLLCASTAAALVMHAQTEPLPLSHTARTLLCASWGLAWPIALVWIYRLLDAILV